MPPGSWGITDPHLKRLIQGKISHFCQMSSGMYGDLRSVTVRTLNLMHILCSLLSFRSLVSMASVCLVDPWARQWVPHWLGRLCKVLWPFQLHRLLDVSVLPWASPLFHSGLLHTPPSTSIATLEHQCNLLRSLSSTLSCITKCCEL